MEPTPITADGWADVALRYEALRRAAGETHLPKELRQQCEAERAALAAQEFEVPVRCVLCNKVWGRGYVTTGLEISKWIDRPRGICGACDIKTTAKVKKDSPLS